MEDLETWIATKDWQNGTFSQTISSNFYAALLFFYLNNVFLKLPATLHTWCGVVFFLPVIKA
jgi:hypothetical protein